MCSVGVGRSVEIKVELTGVLEAFSRTECKGVAMFVSSTFAGSISVLFIRLIGGEKVVVIMVAVVVVVFAVVSMDVGLANTTLRKSWNLANASYTRVSGA